jgi:aspartate kinase
MVLIATFAAHFIAMKILKFGGTSVGKPDRMKSLVGLVCTNQPKIVVLSALSGSTDALVKICNLLHNHQKETAQNAIGEL